MAFFGLSKLLFIKAYGLKERSFGCLDEGMGAQHAPSAMMMKSMGEKSH
jgi:hypothetical protein